MLTHVDSENKPTMVNVTDKSFSHRTAIAQSELKIPKSVLDLLQNGEIRTKKGPVFDTAIVAGTMAVKRCADTIPFCHAIPVEGCKFNIELTANDQISVQCRVETTYKTGVEMEALMGASIAALTIYDMCKAISHDIEIVNTRLIKKTGGKSDYKNNKA